MVFVHQGTREFIMFGKEGVSHHLIVIADEVQNFSLAAIPLLNAIENLPREEWEAPKSLGGG